MRIDLDLPPGRDHGQQLTHLPRRRRTGVQQQARDVGKIRIHDGVIGPRDLDAGRQRRRLRGRLMGDASCPHCRGEERDGRGAQPAVHGCPSVMLVRSWRFWV